MIKSKLFEKAEKDKMEEHRLLSEQNLTALQNRIEVLKFCVFFQFLIVWEIEDMYAKKGYC